MLCNLILVLKKEEHLMTAEKKKDSLGKWNI